MFCHVLNWCILVWRLKLQHLLVETWAVLPSFCSKGDKCGNEAQMRHLAPPESSVVVSRGFRVSWRLWGSSQDQAHQEYSVWANMQILGSANTNTVNYTVKTYTAARKPYDRYHVVTMLWDFRLYWQTFQAAVQIYIESHMCLRKRFISRFLYWAAVTNALLPVSN